MFECTYSYDRKKEYRGSREKETSKIDEQETNFTRYDSNFGNYLQVSDEDSGVTARKRHDTEELERLSGERGRESKCVCVHIVWRCTHHNNTQKGKKECL